MKRRYFTFNISHLALIYHLTLIRLTQLVIIARLKWKLANGKCMVNASEGEV